MVQSSGTLIMNWFVKNVIGGVFTAPTVHPETDDDETHQIAQQAIRKPSTFTALEPKKKISINNFKKKIKSNVNIAVGVDRQQDSDSSSRSGSRSSSRSSPNNRILGIKANRKGKKYDKRHVFTSNEVESVLRDLIINRQLGAKHVDYLSLPKLASKYLLKEHDIRKIKDYDEKGLNIQHVLGQLNHHAGTLSFNQIQNIKAAEFANGKGLTVKDQNDAMTKGAILDIKMGLNKKVNNSDCAKDYNEFERSKYMDNRINKICDFTDRKAKRKFEGREIKIDELWGHTAAGMYAFATFENPKRDDLGDRRTDEGLTINIDDTCVEWGYNMDQAYTVKVSAASKNWMDETRFNCVAVIEGDKIKRTCVHVRPVVAESGNLFGLITYNKDRNTDGIKIFPLREHVENYAFYYVLVGPLVNQLTFENEMMIKIIYPIICRERTRLIDQSIRLQIQSILITENIEEVEIDEERRSILVAKANLQYENASLFTDGAYGFVGSVEKDYPLATVARDLKIWLYKWAAKHSICQNSLDASHSFVILHGDYSKINVSGVLSNEVPSWHQLLSDILDVHISESSRRTSILLFHSFLPRVIEHGLSTHINAKGWIANGAGVGLNPLNGQQISMFRLNVWLNHWKGFRLLSDEERDELYSLFWDQILPEMATNLGFITFEKLYNICKEFLQLGELDVSDNRNLRAFNQGFAMPMQQETFLLHAVEKLRIQNLESEISTRNKLEANAIKKAATAQFNNLISRRCSNIDNQKDIDIQAIEDEKNADIEQIKTSLADRKCKLSGRLTTKSTKTEKEVVKSDIANAIENSKTNIGLIRKGAKSKVDRVKEDWTKERKDFIKIFKRDIKNNGGYIEEDDEMNEDDEEMVQNDENDGL